MGRLTTHVLDLANGCPGRGIKVELFQLKAGRTLVRSDRTNDDGRCDAPLAEGAEFVAGSYELVFDAGSYFEATGALNTPKFLDQVVIRFNIADASEHYHVPLLLSPYGYSTYRGS